jgi:hypothetical protein
MSRNPTDSSLRGRRTRGELNALQYLVNVCLRSEFLRLNILLELAFQPVQERIEASGSDLSPHSDPRTSKLGSTQHGIHVNDPASAPTHGELHAIAQDVDLRVHGQQTLPHLMSRADRRGGPGRAQARPLPALQCALHSAKSEPGSRPDRRFRRPMSTRGPELGERSSWAERLRPGAVGTVEIVEVAGHAEG